MHEVNLSELFVNITRYKSLDVLSSFFPVQGETDDNIWYPKTIHDRYRINNTNIKYDTTNYICLA